MKEKHFLQSNILSSQDAIHKGLNLPLIVSNLLILLCFLPLSGNHLFLRICCSTLHYCLSLSLVLVASIFVLLKMLIFFLESLRYEVQLKYYSELFHLHKAKIHPPKSLT